MFKLSEFNKKAYDIAIDISNKRYSDTGIMWEQLSKITGIEIGTLMAYDDWYILKDGFYYFKYIYTIEELFISEIAHECKVRCVEFLLALDDDNLGIISKLYREKDKSYYMYDEFCDKYIDCYPENLNTLKLSLTAGFGEDKTRRLMDDIFDIISLDIFCGQCDRADYNFFFECDRNNNVRIAPLCDNGFAFDYSFIYESPFGKLNLNESYILDGNLPFILMNERNFYNKLVMYLDINVSSVLDRTCEKYKIDLNELDKSRLLSYFDYRKRAIEHTLKLSRNNR